MNKFYLLSIILLLPFISAVNFDSGELYSTGLNSTIKILNVPIDFDSVNVYNNSIEFYNLEYANPLTCGGGNVHYDFYNFTAENVLVIDFLEPYCLDAVVTGTSSGTISGGGSSGVIVSSQNFYVNVNTNPVWYSEQKNSLLLNIYDKNDVKIDADSINLTSMDNSSLSYTKTRLGVGYYILSVTLNENNNENITMKLDVTKNSEVLSQILKYPLRKATLKERILMNEAIKEFLLEHPNFWILFIFSIVILVISIIFIKLLYKKRN